jgi:hypothetical protein
MAAYDSRYNPFIRQLEELRKSNPSLVAQIENRANEIYKNYSEDETYRKDRLSSRARAMEQAVKEYVDRSNTFRGIDKRLGTTPEVADRELSMAETSSSDVSGLMDMRKDRLLKVEPDANLQKTPTGMSDQELLEQMAMQQLEIGDYEKEEKRINNLFSEELSSLGPDTYQEGFTETQPDEYYYDLPGPRRKFKEQTLSPDNGVSDEEAEKVESETDTIPERPDAFAEEDTDTIDEDVDAFVEKFLVETAYDDPPKLDTQGLEPQSRILSTLRKYGPAIMQALGAGGESYFDSRAVGKANKANRRSQARANLINALSRGGGARGAQVAPEKGVGSALFKSLSGLGKGLEVQREAQETNEYRRKQQELAERRLSRGEARAEKLEKTKQAETQLKEYKREADVLMGVIESAATSGALNSKNFEQWLSSSPSVAKIYNNLPKQYQDLLRAGASGAVSNAEPGEATSLTNTVNILEDQYNTLDDPGEFFSGLLFDAYSFVGEKFASRMLPGESVYESIADAFTIRLASAFNDGRPSNADAAAVANLLPRLGMGEEANRQKFAILRKLADFAKFAANKNFKIPGASDGLISSGIITPDGNVDVEKLEEYRREIGMPTPSANAQTSSAFTNTSDNSWADGDLE